MSRNRYVGDYHLADSLDDRGRIRTEVEYVGALYSFVKDDEAVRKTKRCVLFLCAIGWLAYTAAMIPVSAAMRTYYTAIPFVFIAVPLALLTGTVFEVLPLRERFIHRHADRIENRWPSSCMFIAFLSGVSLLCEAVNLIRGLEMQTGDLLFAFCAPVILLTGILAFRARNGLQCRKV